jgi:hypothetical protein
MRSLPLAAVFALLASSVGACSSDPPVLLDGSITDADPLARCLIPGSYGALGAKTGTADLPTVSPNSLTIVLDAGPPKDDFFVKLVPGLGAFSGGALKTGTFTIAGADANMVGCGLCTSLLADIAAGSGPQKFYYADSGTITLTSATAATSTSTSMIAGSAQDLHFVETDGAGTPIPGGCTSTIKSITFGP